MKITSDTGLIAALLIIVVWLAGVVGWVMNIVAIATGTFDPVTPMMVLRLIGVFMLPLGGVLGWF